jgi:hypothetical protein
MAESTVDKLMRLRRQGQEDVEAAEAAEAYAEFVASEQEAAYEPPPVADKGPDEYSAGHVGEWGLEAD